MKNDTQKPKHECGLDNCFDQVVQFQRVFKNPVSEEPFPLSDGRLAVRVKYLREEVNELANARTLEAQCDALIDVIYFALGGFAETGIRPQAIFEIVHNANMKKLFSDGEPRHRVIDGKVAKPPNWQSPETLIRREIDRQTRAFSNNEAQAPVINNHLMVKRPKSRTG
ncbi:MAG: hypothetical protein ACR2KT_19010 [Methylocella sp.]|nr:MAG: HAD family hydrolase [Hyphomicrobiales bacterium]